MFYPLPPADGPVLPQQEFDLSSSPHASSFAPPAGAGTSWQTCVESAHNFSLSIWQPKLYLHQLKANASFWVEVNVMATGSTTIYTRITVHTQNPQLRQTYSPVSKWVHTATQQWSLIRPYVWQNCCFLLQECLLPQKDTSTPKWHPVNKAYRCMLYRALLEGC